MALDLSRRQNGENPRISRKGGRVSTDQNSAVRSMNKGVPKGNGFGTPIFYRADQKHRRFRFGKRRRNGWLVSSLAQPSLEAREPLRALQARKTS
jgi:hypothetical protein